MTTESMAHLIAEGRLRGGLEQELADALADTSDELAEALRESVRAEDQANNNAADAIQAEAKLAKLATLADTYREAVKAAIRELAIARGADLTPHIMLALEILGKPLGAEIRGATEGAQPMKLERNDCE